MEEEPVCYLHCLINSSAQDQAAGKRQRWDCDPRSMLLESLIPHLQGGGGRGMMKVGGFGGYLERKLLEFTWVKCRRGTSDETEERGRMTT